jgi:hypothetical protein
LDSRNTACKRFKYGISMHPPEVPGRGWGVKRSLCQ